MTFDDTLDPRDYTDPSRSKLIGYEEYPQTITTLALVRSKKDVFVDTITHILVLAIETDLIPLGVSAATMLKGSRAVNLYSTEMTSHRMRDHLYDIS